MKIRQTTQNLRRGQNREEDDNEGLGSGAIDMTSPTSLSSFNYIKSTYCI